MNDLIIFLIAIIVHESGHYFTYYYITNKKPKLWFSIFGVHIGNNKQVSQLTLKQQIVFLANGVVAGFIVLVLFNKISMYYNFFYTLLSSFDLFIIFAVMNAKKEYNLSWDTKIKDIPCERCKRLGVENVKNN